MAGIYGKSGDEYWNRQIEGVLSGLNRQPITPPMAQSNTGGATVSPTGIDWNKFNFGQGQEEQPQEEEPNFLQKAVEAPVIKQVLDAVSVFNYAGANIADNMVDSAEQGKGPLSYVGDVFEGIGEGVTGAFGGNSDNAKGYGEVIRRIQDNMGVDTESTGAKWASGLGGFAGDVLLDPTTYIGVGAIKGAASGIKSASKYGTAVKQNKALDALGETAEVTEPLRKTVPGKYNPEIQSKIDEVRKYRGDAGVKLDPSNSLPFDAIRPSRKAAEIEEIKLNFKANNPGAQIREAASGRFDAFKAGYADSIQKFRLEERARKLSKVENKAARKMMKLDPDKAIVDLIKLPFDNLTQNVLEMSDTAATRSAMSLVKTADDIMGVERSADELVAVSADLVETIKMDAVAGNTTDIARVLNPTGKSLIHKGGKPNNRANRRAQKESVRKAVETRNKARQRKAQLRRVKSAENTKSVDDQFWDEVNGVDSLPEGVAVNAVSDAEKAIPETDPWGNSAEPSVAKSDEIEDYANPELEAQRIIETDTTKPGAVTPQEVQRAAEDYTDIADDLLSNPHTFMRMKVRSVEETRAVDAAFAFAKAVLPSGKHALGNSEFFYPASVIEKARKLNNAVGTDADLLNAYRALNPTQAEYDAVKRALASGTKIRRATLRRTDPKFAKAEASTQTVPAKMYTDIGIHPKDVEFARKDELSTTSASEYERNFQTLVKHIRNLKSDIRSDVRYKMDEDHPLWETVEELEEVFGVSGPRAVATALVKANKSPLWREAMRYATGERINKRDLQGITETVGEDYVKASLKLVPTEETAEIFTAARNQAIEDLDNLAPELRTSIDRMMIAALKYQKTPGGKNTTFRVGATTDGDNLGAIINKHWNTQANLKTLKLIQEKLNGYNKAKMFSDIEHRDRTTMAALRYYENTLREAGIDSHLTNMAEPYTKMVNKTLPDGSVVQIETKTGQYSVRLGLSDIYGAMTPDLRMQFLYGDLRFNPTQFLDLGEALVRGARELDPLTGGVDESRAKLLAKLAITGERGNHRIFMDDGTTRLSTIDDVELIKKSDVRYMGREVHHNLDDVSRLAIIDNAMKKITDLDGNYLLSKQEFAAMRAIKDPDERIKAMSVLLDGKNLDGDNIINSAIDAVKAPIENDLIEAFFQNGADGRKPFTKLVETSINNSMMVGKKITDDVVAHSAAEYDKLINALESNSVSKVIEVVATESKALRDLPIEGQALAKQAIDDEVTKLIPAETIDSLKAQASVASKVTPENANTVRMELIPEPEISTKVIEKIDPKTAEDANAVNVLEYDAGIANFSLAFANRFGRAFNPNLGMAQSSDIVTKSTHVIPAMIDSVTRQYKRWESQGITSKNLTVSLNKIKNMVKNDGDLDSLTGIDKEVYDFFNIMFDTSKYNFFKANGIEGPAMNRFKFNLQQSFGTDIAKSLGKLEEDGQDIGKLWTQLPINDPYSFSSRLFYVYAKTAQETMIAADFSKRFGLKVSPERAKELGLVKIVDRDDKNIFARMIDSNLYYPKELGEEVVYINRLLNANRSFGPQLQGFMENVWDPVVSVLKMGQTSIKPGHHVMSVVGDWWRNLMITGSPMTREYKQSAHLVGYLRQQRKSELPMDALQRKLESFAGYEFESVADGANNDKFITLMISQGGKKKPTKIDVPTLVNLGEQHGVFFAPHSGGVSEDLLSGASAGIEGTGLGKGIKKISDKLLDNKMTAAINAFSADRDGLMRGALFLHYLQSKKFKSLEDAAIYAGDKVRKAAPVASDLTAWESKYMRRGVFYYTWLRGITPRVLETLITRPGLAMIPSKGMYELAEANGLDPNSFGDPMSEEIKSNLPDYYAERVMGPAYQDSATGDYWGFSTASPTIDVLNSFGSNVSLADALPNPYRVDDNAAQKMGQTLIGMVTPWVKMPYEMATGRRLDTGAPIDSNWQYLIDQNSWARTASKVTGKIAPGLNRTETRFREGIEDPSGNAIHELLANFATNSQLMNYSADNVEKAAQFQERDEQSEVRKLLQRLGQTEQE